MQKRTIVRLSAISALAAGSAWCLLSVLSILEREPRLYLDMLFIVPYTLTIGAVIGIHVTQREQAGRLGRVGVWISVSGMAAILAGIVAHIAGADTLRTLMSIVGFVLWVPGFVLFGIAIARARVLPVWCGAAIALSQPLTVAAAIPLTLISPVSASGFGSYPGAIVHGIVWLAIGAVLRAHRYGLDTSSQRNGDELGQEFVSSASGRT